MFVLQNNITDGQMHFINQTHLQFRSIPNISGYHHSIKKQVGPPAGPHHFINANMFQNPFFLDIWIVWCYSIL